MKYFFIIIFLYNISLFAAEDIFKAIKEKKIEDINLYLKAYETDFIHQLHQPGIAKMHIINKIDHLYDIDNALKDFSKSETTYTKIFLGIKTLPLLSFFYKLPGLAKEALLPYVLNKSLLSKEYLQGVCSIQAWNQAAKFAQKNNFSLPQVYWHGAIWPLCNNLLGICAGLYIIKLVKDHVTENMKNVIFKIFRNKPDLNSLQRQNQILLKTLLSTKVKKYGSLSSALHDIEISYHETIMQEELKA